MMRWIIDGQDVVVPDTATVLDAIATREDLKSYLGIRMGGKVRGLTYAPKDGTEIHLLTYADEPGRRIMERSLIFLYLLAVRDIFPGTRVTIEHALGPALLTRIHRAKLTAQDVARIERRMRELSAWDLPIEEVTVPVEEALAYFTRDVQLDKVRLLSYRPFEYFHLYRCGGMMQYFYGEMLPRTSWMTAFALLHTPEGVLLVQPDRADPTKPATYRPMPKLAASFTEAERWGEKLHCSTAADLNELVESGRIREFIRVSEAQHEHKVVDIVKSILTDPGRVVLISGPSSSGKTTFTHRLATQLMACERSPVVLSLDDYYLDRDLVPLLPNGKPDLECLESLDVALFNEHLAALLRGEAVEIPKFDFSVARRAPKGRMLRVERNQPILVEGIHGLNDRLTESVEDGRKFRIFISCLTQLNLDDHNRIRTTDSRLLRRLVRDWRYRSSSLERTFDMWADVHAGEYKYIFPYQERADVLFNSSLSYELVVLKGYVYDLLRDIPPESAHHSEARRLVKFLNYFLPADVENEIPPTSILREFIGGCAFYRPQ